MCVHMQVMECSCLSWARLLCTLSRFVILLCRSFCVVLVCQCVKNWKLRVSLTSPSAPGQCPLPCEVMPDWPAARQNICFRGGETQMFGESARAGAESSCFWVLLPLCLPFSNPGGVCLQLKLPLTGATQLVLATGTNTMTAICKATR